MIHFYLLFWLQPVIMLTGPGPQLLSSGKVRVGPVSAQCSVALPAFRNLLRKCIDLQILGS